MRCILSIDLGVKNLGYSIISYSKFGKLSFEDLTLKFGIFNIAENIPKKNNVVTGRCNALHTFFNDIAETYTIDFVIIERQVSRNTMAMELMYATTAIALFHCPDVIIFDPKSKFSKLDIEFSTEKKKHKKQSSEFARNLIKNKFNETIDEFDSYEKKDDISDSLNQCFVWMLDNGFLTINKDEFKDVILRM
jgi:hypothetical protein